MNNVANLVNRCPSTALGFKTLEEIWNDIPQSYENLKVFRFVAYAHIRQSKLETRAKRCMFIGYPDGVNEYKLWYSNSNISKSVNCKDVTFRESKRYMSNLSSSSHNESTDVITDAKIEVE